MNMDAAIYCRISNDSEGREAGVARQEEDCRKLASRLGYAVAAVFIDNDVSASTRSAKPRPQYERMLAGARAGRYGAILAYSTSRLTRRPREYDDLIDLSERDGVLIHTVASGDHDLTLADGRAIARTIAAWDAAEAERTGERVKRAFDQRAQQGKRHGKPPFGWQLVDGEEVPHLEQAELIRECARRLLARESLRSVVTGLNEHGLASPRGNPWDSQTLRQVMLRESNAGRLVHRGKVVGKGVWVPIYDEATHDRVVALLRDPARSASNRGAPRRHLLSGLALCGRCGTTMRVNVGNKRDASGARRAPAYICPGCFRVRRRADQVDGVVEGLIIARLGLPDGPALFGGDPDAIAAAEARLDVVRARLATAADQFADGILTGEQLARITTRLRPEEAAAARAIHAAQPVGNFSTLTSGDVAAAWAAAPLNSKREAIRVLMDVTILPTGAGGAFDPSSVHYQWRK